MLEKFSVEKVYETRPHERHHFKVIIEGKAYKGSFHDNEIRWHHPHPKQVVGEEKMQQIETDIQELLIAQDVASDLDGIEVKPFLKNYCRKSYDIKLKVNGEEFRGMFEDNNLKWFHPKPHQKLQHDHAEKVDKQVHEKVKENLTD